MRLTKKYLRKLVVEEFNLLLEEEGDEEVTEEDPGEGEEVTEEDPAAEDVEGEEEEEEEVQVDAEEEATLSKSADDQILAHIIDFETKAIKSASLVSDEELRPDPDGMPIDLEVAAESRWYKNSLRNMLFEEEKKDLTSPSWVGSPDIDIAVFSTDVARLVMNYDSLIDMEALIINKAKNYLSDQYDVETADYFEELMDVEHDMRSIEHPSIDTENEMPESPPAVGSGFASQAGGGA